MMTENPERIPAINPATGSVIGEIAATPAQMLPDIVARARAAHVAWSSLGVRKRIEILSKLNPILLNRMDSILHTITIDNGKTLMEALVTEFMPVLDTISFCATEGPAALGDEPLSNPIFPIARIESFNRRESMGVVGIISPWNFPFAIPTTQILMALTAGNSVILKPSEFTPLVGDLIRDLFERIGLPDGVLSVVQGPGTLLGDPLLDAGIDKLVFTGSIPVGQHLMRKASETLTPIALELGGKDPFIVLEDADIDRAASAAVWGAFVNAGQVCASVERVYVHSSVAKAFIDAVVDKTRLLRVGDGLLPTTDMGPMIDAKRILTVREHIDDARLKGASILTGGKALTDMPGFFFQPTVLSQVDHSMLAMTRETFGPTLPIMTFNSEDEAVRLANDSPYGLLASVWSSDHQWARRIAGRIRAGTVIINNCLITYGFAQCPWGGVKNSGFGTTHSIHGFHEFSNLKNITTQKNLLHNDPWWHPYSDQKLTTLKAAAKTLYCKGILCKVDGLTTALNSLRIRKPR